MRLTRLSRLRREEPSAHVREIHRQGTARARARAGGSARAEPALRGHGASAARPDPRGRGHRRQGLARPQRHLQRLHRADKDHQRRRDAGRCGAHPLHPPRQARARRRPARDAAAGPELHLDRAFAAGHRARGSRCGHAGARAAGRGRRYGAREGEGDAEKRADPRARRTGGLPELRRAAGGALRAQGVRHRLDATREKWRARPGDRARAKPSA